MSRKRQHVNVHASSYIQASVPISSNGRQRQAFHARIQRGGGRAGGPDPSEKSQNKKKTLSKTPSDKTFWIRACVPQLLSKVFIFENAFDYQGKMVLCFMVHLSSFSLSIKCLISGNKGILNSLNQNFLSCQYKTMTITEA